MKHLDHVHLIDDQIDREDQALHKVNSIVNQKVDAIEKLLTEIQHSEKDLVDEVEVLDLHQSDDMM